MMPPGERFWLRTVVFVALAGFILLPFVQTLIVSFTSTLPRPDMPEGTFSLVNYENIALSPALRDSILTSIAYVSMNVVLCLAVAFPAAYAFSRYGFVGDRHFFFLLLTFRLTPPVVLSLPIFILFSQFHLVNSPVGIALVHCLFNVPIAIWILESFISAVPAEFDETAFLDGHSQLSFLVRHLIPLIAPGLGVAAFFCFVFSWVEVVFARILTVTAGKPITMAINALFSFQTDMGLVTAMAVVSLLPGVAMLFLVRNHIARGFMLRA